MGDSNALLCATKVGFFMATYGRLRLVKGEPRGIVQGRVVGEPMMTLVFYRLNKNY